MRFMVIERFTHGPGPVYERPAARGRMIPEGLRYLDSWSDANDPDRCFQLMATGDPALIDAWIAAWSDLTEFVPVPTSAQAAARAGVTT